MKITTDNKIAETTNYYSWKKKNCQVLNLANHTLGGPSVRKFSKMRSILVSSPKLGARGFDMGNQMDINFR